MKSIFVFVERCSGKLFFFLFVLSFVSYGCRDDLNQSIDSNEAVEIPEQSGKYHYYAGGKKYFLELNTNYMFVSSINESSISSLKLPRDCSIDEIRKDNAGSVSTGNAPVERFWTVITIHEEINDVEYEKLIKDLREINKDVIVAPYFKNELRDKLGLSNYFYVNIKKLSDKSLLADLAIKTKTVIVGPNVSFPDWYIMSITPETDKNALEMANFFYETGLFRHAEPDLIGDLVFDDVFSKNNRDIKLSGL